MDIQLKYKDFLMSNGIINIISENSEILKIEV